MSAALRSHTEELESRWSEPGFGIGLLERPHPAKGANAVGACSITPWKPAQRGDVKLWMAGEAFHHQRLNIETPVVSPSLELCDRLLDDVLDEGLEAIRLLDGEFWVALWNRKERILRLANDRFGSLPLYFGESSEGVAVAGGVRGVLMAPGIDPTADPEAIREAVTFGGYRLGDRTNVSGVRMLPCATISELSTRGLRQKRYWSFGEIPSLAERPLADLTEEAAALWTQAISRRVRGSGRFGQTLSGGLDSRAILAEGAPRKPIWATVSYGIPKCDDVRYARRAAEVVGALWAYRDIYADPTPDWLTARSRHIQRTDGLIDLFDLMHVESVEIQTNYMDIHVSGYVGDAICGPTFAGVDTLEDVMAALPFYGTLAMSLNEARQRAQRLIDDLNGAPPRYAIFDNKLPQATNRWTAAWRPWLAVRKPFLDYAFFDFWQGLPLSARLEHNLYEHFLSKRYPHLFNEIPNQRTGVPILTPKWRHQLVRGLRFLGRKAAPFLGLRPTSRAYHDVARQWTTRDNRARIEGTILRDDSLCAEILGRERLTTFLRGWFNASAGPTQVVAALYVYEYYHRDLGAHLQAAKRSASTMFR